MKRLYIITVISSIGVLLLGFILHSLLFEDKTPENIKVGFIYVGDASQAYTHNFLKAQNTIESKYSKNVTIVAQYNVPEPDVENALKTLVEEECDIIFSTSYGYGEKTKEYAEKYPDIEFCQATCSNANESPVLDNYHTFMGTIYEGRYISGYVAGMKIRELIDDGLITPEQAVVGYVAAFPYAEVISGYTAFFMGIRAVVPEATMLVKYTNTWSSYSLEKQYASELIDMGCVIISQHSDTFGPAVACEEASVTKNVFHIGYNQSMADVAPTTYLTGSRIDWEPYIVKAVEAMLYGEEIENYVEGNVNGNDIGGGFKEGWVKMLEINTVVCAEGTQANIEKLIKDFKKDKIQVFYGDYTGVNPYDENDKISLKKPYKENKDSSAPTFNYVLDDVIKVIE